jgi:excisionase family DNA binding protein
MASMKTQPSNYNPDPPIALRVNDAAALSGLSRSSLYKLLSEKRLRSIVVCGRRLFLREDILALLHDAADRGA